MLTRLEEFETEKQILRHENNSKMNELEAKILSLESELKNHNSMSEKDLTIEQLQDHIRVLEQHIYRQELG